MHLGLPGAAEALGSMEKGKKKKKKGLKLKERGWAEESLQLCTQETQYYEKERARERCQCG